MTTAIALSDLRAILLGLPAAGTAGFEGLAATCISSLAGVPLRLAKSGLQFGRDMSSAPDEFAIAAECKLYRNDLRLEDLIGKVRLAADHLAGDIDLWALCSTAEVGDVTVKELDASLRARGVDLVMLDWPDAGLPPLAVLLAATAARARNWFDAHAPVQTVRVRAALATISTHPDFPVGEANLQSRFARGSIGLAALQASAGRWLEERLADPELSRIDLGQVVGLDLGGIAGAERADLVRELGSAMRVLGDASQIVAVIGEEGAGKTWLVARWWAWADPRAIPIVISGKRVELLDASDPVGSLARILALQECSADEPTIASWRRRLQRWKGHGSGALRFMLVLDGLNEHPTLPWSTIVRAYGRELRNLGGLVCVTCRPEFWAHQVAPRLGEGPTVRRINVVNLPVDEVKALVARAGHDPEQLDDAVLEFIRTPRVFSVALGLLDRLAVAPANLTRERLLLEYWRARMAERGDSARHNAAEFNAVLRAHAEAWRKAGGGHFARDDLPDRDPATRRRDAADLAGDLSDIEEGRFLNSVGDGENYAFRKEVLPFALGLLVDRELADAGRRGLDPDAELQKAVGPVAGFDLLSEILAAALIVTSARDPKGEAAAAIARAYFSLQNLTEPSRHAAHAQLRTAPAPFLAAAELPVDDPRSASMDRRLLAGMLLHERCAPTLAAALADRLDGWLGAWCMAPRPMQWDGEAERRARHEKLVGIRLDELERNGELPTWQALASKRAGLSEPMLDLLASRVLAGRPQASYGAGLAGWGLVGGIAPDVNRARDDVPWTVRLNLHDHADTAAAITAALPNPDGMRSRPLREGAAIALRLPGLPELDAVAERLSPTPPPPQPRRRLSDQDPADPDAESGAATEAARRQALGVDPGQAWSTFGTGGDDDQLKEVTPVLARHDPATVAETVRRIAATAPARQGMALRQLGWRLPENSPLLDEAAREAVRSALEAAIANPALLPADDRDWIAGWMARSLMPWLDADRQLALFQSLPEGMPLFLNIQPELAALQPERLHAAFAAARQKGGERLRRILFFAAANPGVPLDDHSRSTVLDAFFSTDVATATSAADLIAGAKDMSLDEALLREVDGRGLDPGIDDELYWRQRAYAIACARCGRADPNNVPPRFAGEVAAALGGPALDAFAARMDTLVGRLATPAPAAPPADVGLFIGLDVSFPGVTRWTEAQEPPTRDRKEGLEAVFEKMNAPDGGLAADRDERRSITAVANSYRERLQASGFGEVATEPQIAGIEAATAQDPGRSARWLRTTLAQTDPAVRAQLANVGLVLAQAVADHDDALAAEALTRLRGFRPSVEVVIGPERASVRDWALVRASRAPGPATLLAAEFETAREDARLAALSRLADALGAGAWLDRWLESSFADQHPAKIARALTVAGLRPNAATASRLEEDRGTGFLGQVAAHARTAARHRAWTRHWLNVARSTDDPVAFWAAGTLAATVADLRSLADWRENEMAEVARRFEMSLLERLRSAAEKREGERAKTLFGLKAPEESLWEAIEG